MKFFFPLLLLLFVSSSVVTGEEVCNRKNDFCFDTWPEPGPAKCDIRFPVEPLKDFNIYIDHMKTDGYIWFEFYDPKALEKDMHKEFRFFLSKTSEEAKKELLWFLKGIQVTLKKTEKPDFSPGDICFADVLWNGTYMVAFCVNNVFIWGSGDKSVIQKLSLEAEKIIKNAPLCSSGDKPEFIISEEFKETFHSPPRL